jgi:cobalamin biosynthesis protein CobT
MRAQIYETALERIARTIARQHHIEVVFQGSGARTDGSKIFLPSTKGLSAEMLADLNGYIDHEVAHCKFTDFSEILHVVNSFHKFLLNAVEDVRIERLMSVEFPGCRYNLDALNERLLVKVFAKWDEIAAPMRFCMAVSLKMTDQLNLVPMDALLQGCLDVAADEIDRLNSCETTHELRLLTEEIVRKVTDFLKEEREKEEASKDGTDAETDSSEESADESDSEGSEDSEESEGGEGEGEIDDEDESDSEGSGESDSDADADETESGDESDGIGADETEGDAASDDESEASDSSDTTQSTPGDRPVTPEDVEQATGDDSDWEAVPLTVDDMINDALEAEIKEFAEATGSSANSVHVPFSTQFDVLEDYTGKGDKPEYSRQRGLVKSVVGSVKREFEKALKVIENSRWTSERERGRLDTRNLHRLVSDKNFRKPFKTKLSTDTSNVAVQILIDMSGSMHGEPIALAKKTGIAMAEALKELGIAFEVTGFYSKTSSKLARASRAAGDTSRFNRTTEALHKCVFKRFDSHDLSGIERLYTGVQNPDGEAVRWAANRLSTQKQTRKILMVLSDGQPYTQDSNNRLLQKDLKAAVKEIEKHGVETIGVGICSNAVKHYYNDSVVVDSLEDLPKQALGQLTKIILRGMRNG